MADLQDRLKRVGDVYRIYLEMPLQERLDLLGKIKDSKSNLERELKEAEGNIMLLENMPDIAETRVLKDDLSKSLITKLRETGKIAYRDFVKELNLPGEYSNLIIINRLYALKTAQIVNMTPDLSHSGDELIELTERGRTIEYSSE